MRTSTFVLSSVTLFIGAAVQAAPIPPNGLMPRFDFDQFAGFGISTGGCNSNDDPDCTPENNAKKIEAENERIAQEGNIPSSISFDSDLIHTPVATPTASASSADLEARFDFDQFTSFGIITGGCNSSDGQECTPEDFQKKVDEQNERKAQGLPPVLSFDSDLVHTPTATPVPTSSSVPNLGARFNFDQFPEFGISTGGCNSSDDPDCTPENAAKQIEVEDERISQGLPPTIVATPTLVSSLAEQTD